eukprot:14780178-Alexandrium_andersonii.AAC.1
MSDLPQAGYEGARLSTLPPRLFITPGACNSASLDCGPRMAQSRKHVPPGLGGRAHGRTLSGLRYMPAATLNSHRTGVTSKRGPCI